MQAYCFTNYLNNQKGPQSIMSEVRNNQPESTKNSSVEAKKFKANQIS